MDHNWKSLLSTQSYEQASNDLVGDIMREIDASERRGLFITKAISYGSVALLSFAALIPAITELYSELAQSGFLQFISLIQSDYEIILGNMGNFMLTLAESFPTISVVMALGIALLCIYTFKQCVNNVSALHHHSTSFA